MTRYLSIALLLAAAFSSHALAEDTPKKSISSEELPAPAKEEQPLEYSVVVLQGLNKVTGQIQKFDSPVGSTTRFGTLEIALHRCWKSAPEDRPENAALMEISELKTGEAPQKVFFGWMFSSTPGLSGLEHPVYDVTLLGCETTKEDAPKKEEEKPQAKEPAKDKKKP